MTELEFAWVLPSTGDGEHIGTWMPEREPTLELLTRTARTCDEAGYRTILVTVGAVNNHFGPDAPYVDPFVAAAAIVPATERLRPLVALRSGTMLPATAARMCSTLDVLSGGRLSVNAVSGGRTLTMYGERDEHAERYARTDEQLTVLRGLWTEERFSFRGRFYSAEDAIMAPKPLQRPHPPIYFAGQSPPAREVGARHADCMLLPGTTPERAAEYAADMRRRAAEAGRSLRVGTHFYIVARSTESEALEAAEALLARLDPRLERGQAGGNERVAPGLWLGMRRLWGEASLTLIGSYEQVAGALRSFVDAGITTFILTGFPMEAEAARVAEHVMPLVEPAALRG